MKVLIAGDVNPLWCDECGTQVAVAIQVGEPARPDSRTAALCAACVREAFNEICAPES